MKTQMLMVHGGMTFKSHKDYVNHLKHKKVSLKKKSHWFGEYVDKKLGNKLEIIKPRMPNQDNAKYEEWKLVFERYIPLLRKGVILVGGSLGGIFLAKYLSEHKFPVKIRAVYLVCPPFDNSLPGEDLVNGFKLKSDLSLLEKNANKLTLMFSKDDPVVTLYHAEKYACKLNNAEIILYDSKDGHFGVSEFPEFVEMVNQDLKRKL